MPDPIRRAAWFFPLTLLAAFLGSCSAKSPAVVPSVARTSPPPVVAPVFPVMLGIDTLEAEGFRMLQGKRVGLFTHAAGVNRRGENPIEVFRRAPGVRLTAVFVPEHGFAGDIPAGKDVASSVDARTGLPVYSLYGSIREPSRAQLRDIDVFVINLQDIGVRSYTFAASMKYAMEGCFKAGVPVMVLDRPNPLGGLKVDGPLLDASLRNTSLVAPYRVPYVHGLTIGEIARMAHEAPGVLDIPGATRTAGQLTVVPMRGWKREMRWPDTGLTFVPTSPRIANFDAVIGYAMAGLGLTDWFGSDFQMVRGQRVNGPRYTSGIGTQFFHRAISFQGRTPDQLLQSLSALRVPGVGFRKVTTNNAAGQPVTAVYVDVTDWEVWNPTELSFHLMRLLCELRGNNPYARLNEEETRRYNIHVGSIDWFNALRRDGARVDVEAFTAEWRTRNSIYQEQSRKYWLYQ